MTRFLPTELPPWDVVCFCDRAVPLGVELYALLLFPLSERVALLFDILRLEDMGREILASIRPGSVLN